MIWLAVTFSLLVGCLMGYFAGQYRLVQQLQRAWAQLPECPTCGRVPVPLPVDKEQP